MFRKGKVSIRYIEYIFKREIGREIRKRKKEREERERERKNGKDIKR